jgi:outer membrane protein assembly factor BamB
VDFQFLQNGDLDLGSTAPAILPTPANSTIRHLAVQGGKDGTLRLLNLEDLSGSRGPGHIGGEIDSLNVPQGGEILTAPAVWINPRDKSTWLFVANGNGISGLKLIVGKGGLPDLKAVWTRPQGGTSPIVANGVLYYAGSGNVSALNPTTGGVLWSSSAIGAIHWESPIIANGMLYITDEGGSLTAYSR